MASLFRSESSSSGDASPSFLARWLRRSRGSAPPASAPTGGSSEGTSGETADLLAALLDANPDAVCVVDADDCVRAANRTVMAMLGYQPDELVGSTLADALLTPSRRDAYRARLLHASDVPDRMLVRRVDGREIAVDLWVRQAPDGRLATVTLRRAPEAETALDASESRRRTLRTIVNSIPEEVVAMDRSGRVVFRNHASARGETASPDPTDGHAAADAVMQSGVGVVDQEEADAAGGVRRTTRVPVLDRAGAVVGLVAISRDVTAQKASEAQLLADKLDAEATARANREFLATTSHEVRTLMSGVTGMTTLLLDTDLDAEQREFVDTVRSSSQALLTVINDVLDFSKIEAGMLTIEDQPYAIRGAVGETLRMFAQQGAAKGLRLVGEVASDVPETVRGDAARVRQVLANLLSNAIKFTDAGEVKVRVELAPTSAPGRAVLAVAVQDTGAGIAPDRLAAVFERFTQADDTTARTHGGTGLGLAICRRLVEIMGGELSAESVLGEGSVFRFTVVPADASPDAPAADALPGPSEAWISRPGRTEPAADPADEPASPAVAEDAPTVEAPPMEPVEIPAPPSPPTVAEDAPPVVEAAAGQSLVMSMDAILPAARVLLAEDNPVNQKVATLTLRRLGYRPDVVSNGSQAIMAVRRTSYDVVLMDIMMPVMNGLEATRQIKADPGPFPVPSIVALTANAMDGDRQRCLDAGCDDYLAKPVAPEVLAATIERAVRERAEAEATV